MIPIRCHLCGWLLREGSIKYLVTIHIVADFDGVIAEGEGEGLEGLLRSLEGADGRELEEGVHGERAFMVCPACRRHFLAGLDAGGPKGTGEIH